MNVIWKQLTKNQVDNWSIIIEYVEAYNLIFFVFSTIPS